MLGIFAKYAVAQSPYPRPDNLEVVLDKLNKAIASTFDKAPMGVGEFSDLRSLEAFLHKFLEKIPEYVSWNDRKNGNEASMQFTSRYDKPGDPDNDFIDLDALERNVATEIASESEQL